MFWLSWHQDSAVGTNGDIRHKQHSCLVFGNMECFAHRAFYTRPIIYSVNDARCYSSFEGLRVKFSHTQQ